MFELNAPGLDQLIKDMREFTPKLQRKHLTQALRKGMAPVRKSAQQKVPTDTGALKRAITTRANSKLGKRMGGAAMQVGIRGGAKEYVNNARNRRTGRVGQSYEQGGNQFYFRFLEFGTSKLAARPFLRPALAENIGNTTQIVTTELRTAIDRIARERPQP
jgi:HK97 gp10 family phage protein